MAAIVYRFVADGVAGVVKGFGDIERAAGRARTSVKGAAQADAQAAKTYASAARTRSTTAKSVATTEERAAAKTVQIAERTAQQKARIEARNRAYVAKVRDRHFADTQRSEEKAAKTQERARDKLARSAERETKSRSMRESRNEERNRRYAARLRDRHFADEQRAGQAMSRRQERLATQRTRDMARSRAETKRMMHGAASAAIGVGGALLAGGALVGGAAARQALSNQEKAGALSRASRGAGETAVDPSVLRREAEAIAKANPGVKVGDIIDAQAAFVSKTGDLGSARAMGGTFATLSSATGGSISDMANVAAELRDKFGITDDAEMKQAMATLTMQGKAGAFELKDAAGQYGKLGASAAAFGLDKGASGVATLGGLTQIARSATGGPDQAASSVEAMMRQLTAGSEKLQAEGVDIYKRDQSGKAIGKRDITDILVDSISKVGGDDMQAKDIGLQKIFGEEGIRALRPLMATFNEAVKGGGDGAEAMRKQLEAAIHVPGAWADVQQDAAAAQKESSAKLTGAWENLTAKVGDQVLPILASFVEQLADNDGAIETFAGAIGVAAEGLMALVDMLAGIPGLGDMFKRDTSPEAQMRQAMKESERVEGQIAGRGGALMLSPDDPLIQKKIALDTKIAGLEEKFESGPTVQKGPLEEAEFDRQHAAAGGTALQKFMRAGDDPMKLTNPVAMITAAFKNTPEQASLQSRQDTATAAVAIQEQAAADLKAAAAALKDAAGAQKSGGRLSPGNWLGFM